MKTFTICLKNGVIFKIKAKTFYRYDIFILFKDDTDSKTIATFNHDDVSAIIDNNFIESYNIQKSER